MPTRAELHQLVDSLPDDALPAAEMALTHMQSWPPPELAAMRELVEREDEWADQIRAEGLGGIGGGTAFIGPSGAPRARSSVSYEAAGDSVEKTHIVHDGSEFTMIERIRTDAATGSIHFIIELTGPDGTTARHEHRYDLS